MELSFKQVLPACWIYGTTYLNPRPSVAMQGSEHTDPTHFSFFLLLFASMRQDLGICLWVF